jgi:hypothetical protein
MSRLVNSIERPQMIAGLSRGRTPVIVGTARAGTLAHAVVALPFTVIHHTVGACVGTFQPVDWKQHVLRPHAPASYS